MSDFSETSPIKSTEAERETTFAASCDLLHELLEELSNLGKSEEGGMTRLLYSSSWLKAQQHLQYFMQEKGFVTSFDQSGNLYALLEGTDENSRHKPLFTGSHIDTVISGGRFDGALGVAAGMVALLYLNEVYGPPVRSLAAVSLCEEEGSRFPFAFWGSRSVTGSNDWGAAGNLKDAKGISMLEAAEICGFGPNSSYPVRPFEPGGYLELHIEQGAVLEITGTSIGIVTDIVGQKRLDVIITGEANHAGTTPMNYRKDALISTSEMIIRIHELALSYGDPLVATVGTIELWPGAVNVVPGKVVFTLDIRHTDKEIMDRFIQEALLIISELAVRNRLHAQWQEHLSVDPVAMDELWIEQIQNVCEVLDFSYRKMPSGAGHDAQIFAEVCKAAMVFVPSQNGLSHHPEEFTPQEDINRGFRVLVEMLYQYGYRGKTDE